MITLSLCPQTSLVQRTSRLVRVILASKVACQLPCYVLFSVATESEIKYTTRTLHFVRSDDPILVQSHVINNDGQDGITTTGQTRNFEGLVA